jgi:hypothetical protein
MSPTVYRYKKYRFFFFSREEKRMHIHVTCPDGEAKFWLEPIIALDQFIGMNDRQIKECHKIVEENKNDFKKSWKKHFVR